MKTQRFVSAPIVFATEAQRHREDLSVTPNAERGEGSMGRPALQADRRHRIGQKRERLSVLASFALLSDSDDARRDATPIDRCPRLCVSVSLWPNNSVSSAPSVVESVT